MILALLLALADPAKLPGFYIGNQMEMATAIELDSDGTFAYALDYGAVSETAEGRWRLEGERIVLTVEKSQGTEHGPPLASTPLTIDGDVLTFDRYDRTIRYKREGELATPPNRNNKLDKKD